MLTVGLGSALAGELGISTAVAKQGPERLNFGDLEPLVGLMQDTPLEKLQALVVRKLGRGEVDLKQLLQAAALANARSFGGEDYVGMHTLMAMNPAYAMAHRLPEDRRALIVLKILYRNTGQIQEIGGEKVMHAVVADESVSQANARTLRRAVHDLDAASAEAIFASLAERSGEDAYNDLLHVVCDNTDVHRVVFAHRSWDVLDLAGMENAHAMLRQSLRYCLKNEEWSAENRPGPRNLLPKLLDQYKLLDVELGGRIPDDAWIDQFSQTIFSGTADEAGEAVADALAEGMDPEAIGEAISLATNQLVLRDEGRTGKMVRPGKPEGSVHGDSIGVHASDAAGAWRGIARVANHRNTVACLILAGYQAALDRYERGGNFLEWRPRPYDGPLAEITSEDGSKLLRDLDGAIREQNQARACALMHRYGELGHDAQPAIDLMLGYATKEDGALHAEKYFSTATNDFATTRPAFRWRHLVGLARVTASESGQTARGYEEACELLGVPL